MCPMDFMKANAMYQNKICVIEMCDGCVIWGMGGMGEIYKVWIKHMFTAMSEMDILDVFNVFHQSEYDVQNQNLWIEM